MLRFRLAAILKKRGWTPYRLSQVTGLSAPTAYRLADPDHQFGRFTADTMDRICAALEIQPGELLEWMPESTPTGNKGAKLKAIPKGAAKTTTKKAAKR